MPDNITAIFGEWAPQLKVMLQVAVALVLGGIIGLERELAHKPAGFRTHMLVAGACALLMGAGDMVISNYAQSELAPLVRGDPIRIIHSIIIGISFLGAGTIVKERDDRQIAGLTTAATILLAGIIGIVVAINNAILAAGVTLMVIVVLRALNIIEKWTGKPK